MSRVLLFAGGLLNFALALFKIAMPYIFHWREAMGSGAARLWSTLFAENLAMSMLILFYGYISIFRWQELLSTGLGKVVMLSISILFFYRAAVEVLVYKIGVDGVWWRVILFMIIALVYLVPLISAARASSPGLKSPPID